MIGFVVIELLIGLIVGLILMILFFVVFIVGDWIVNIVGLGFVV